jgi:hypothetical protein
MAKQFNDNQWNVINSAMANRFHDMYETTFGWKKGRGKMFHCPNARAHARGTDNNPSCSVDDESGVFNCFSCGFKGNFWSYWRDYACKTPPFRQLVESIVGPSVASELFANRQPKTSVPRTKTKSQNWNNYF